MTTYLDIARQQQPRARYGLRMLYDDGYRVSIAPLDSVEEAETRFTETVCAVSGEIYDINTREIIGKCDKRKVTE